ncbi:hypothetical protein LLE49_12320 [Alicyclobacillus tolerans]|uniref:hypothetical protein n=1 Tax=Alicyclobacillus tolerans TaxID=90970 RepID=UPI001F2F8F76|nr:hypothetical protein [Alicyclobacillus tolerans]MCF8565501.1 hypothetical protein [Alicyclobacillus tolerans]
MANPSPNESDSREKYFVDIDRMVNEGLGGGQVTTDNGLIEHSTTHTLEFPESALDDTKKSQKDD